MINYKQKKEYEDISTKLIINYETLFNDYKTFIDKMYTYGNKLNTQNDADSILRAYIYKYETLLVYRIPFPYCETCIMPTLKELQTFASENQIKNILILTSFIDKKEYNKFIIQKSMNLQFLFFNSKLNNKLFISYLNSIKNKLQ